jgi:hypothetical protein
MLAPTMNFLFGPLILIAIASSLNRTVQGYYFTFGSLLGLQIFFELGLAQVVIQFASHEWAQLRLSEDGCLTGSDTARSRLASLLRFAVHWYLIAASVAGLLLSLAGYVFFSRSPEPGVSWRSPWIVLCILTAVNVVTLPLWAFLEGCGRIEPVYRYRLVSSAIQNVCIVSALFLGCELWTSAIASAAVLGVSVSMLFFCHRRLLVSIWMMVSTSRIDWKHEVLPMQWRIGLSWLSGYFIFALFTPVLFHYRGAIVAGQMGMTWAVASTLSTVSLAWVTPKAATFGVLIAQKQFRALDQLTFKSGMASVAMLVLGTSTVLVALWAMRSFGYSLAERFLPLLPTAIFLLAQVLMQISHIQALYLRAHKHDPFAGLSFLSALLVAVSVLFLGRLYGPAGVATGYILTTATVVLPLGTVIFLRCRREWHSDTSGGTAVC